MNLLKAWKETEGWLTDTELESEKLGPELRWGAKEAPLLEIVQIEDSLTVEQWQELVQIIHSFHNVFREEPGWAKGVEHQSHILPGMVVWEQWQSVPYHLYGSIQ